MTCHIVLNKRFKRFLSMSTNIQFLFLFFRELECIVEQIYITSHLHCLVLSFSQKERYCFSEHSLTTICFFTTFLIFSSSLKTRSKHAALHSENSQFWEGVSDMSNVSLGLFGLFIIYSLIAELLKLKINLIEFI